PSSQSVKAATTNTARHQPHHSAAIRPNSTRARTKRAAVSWLGRLKIGGRFVGLSVAMRHLLGRFAPSRERQRTTQPSNHLTTEPRSPAPPGRSHRCPLREREPDRPAEGSCP